MKVPTRKERFVASKCDRCGKATTTKRQEFGDLFTLPEEWGVPFMDEGGFCQPCIDKYSRDEWGAWLKMNRPEGE